jgi:hypothetical protein
MLRRLVMVIFGFLVAVASGALFLPLAALFDAELREAGLAATLAGFFALVDASMMGDAPDVAVGTFFHILRAALIASCVAPLGVAALIGEVARVRAWVWYAGASGFLAAASPWIARVAMGSPRAGQMSPLEGRVALLFFLTGVVTGSISWLIARDIATPAPRAA